MSKQTPKSYDVIVVGGGVVGASFAVAAAGMGLHTALVDQSEYSVSWSAETLDTRNYAINLASIHLFERLGVWSDIQNMRAQVFRHMHVWDASGFGSISFHAAEIGQAQLGYIIEHKVLLSALYRRLDNIDTLSYLPANRIEDVQWQKDQVRVQLNSGHLISGKLLVAADGRDSKIRHSAGIDTQNWPSKHQAIVANIRLSRSHEETAWQRFLPSGPLAFLPLAENICSIVWSLTPDLAQMHMDSTEKDFLEKLETCIDKRFGKLSLLGKRHRITLAPQHANQYVKHRLCLIGDAAHHIHPLAGQGLNLGMLDVGSLWQVTSRALQHHKDFGHLLNLRRYERWRKGHNYMMLQMMQGFALLFGQANPIIRGTRNLGLNLFDRLAPLKNRIILHACGLRGDLPNAVLDPEVYETV